MGYAEKLEECISFIRESAADYGYYCSAIGDKDKEKCDLEHELELAAETDDARDRVALSLQAVLQERRICKDRMASTAPIAEYITAHEAYIRALNNGCVPLQPSVITPSGITGPLGQPGVRIIKIDRRQRRAKAVIDILGKPTEITLSILTED